MVYDSLSDKEKAAVDWRVNKNYQEQLEGDNAAIARAAYAAGTFQKKWRDTISATPAQVAKVVSEYEAYLTQSHGIGSQQGRSLF